MSSMVFSSTRSLVEWGSTMRGPMLAISMPGNFCTKKPASNTKCMATMRGRQPKTSWNVSLVSCRKSECWFSCQAGADMMTSDVAP